MSALNKIWKITALAALLFTSLLWAADSAPVLLASGRIDDAIAALRGEISTSPDGAAYNLLCRAYQDVRVRRGREADRVADRRFAGFIDHVTAGMRHGGEGEMRAGNPGGIGEGTQRVRAGCAAESKQCGGS